MALTFYYSPFSTSNVTEAILAELDHGSDTPLAERVELSLSNGDTRTPDYLSKVNPNGRIPAIVHNGVSIWDSCAITMYLGEMFGEKKGLYPSLGTARGEAIKWIVWANVTLAEAAARLAYSVGPPGAEKDQQAMSEAERKSNTEKAESARTDIQKLLGILNGELDGQEFLLKEGYCLADTHLWTPVRWMSMMGLDLDAYPNVKAWLGAVQSRPALANL